MKSIKICLCTCFIITLSIHPFFSTLVFAQHDHGPGGHTHSHEGEEAAPTVIDDTPLPTASEAFSDRYEVLLKFRPVEPGEELVMTLFLSDVNTNAPIDSAEVKLVNVDFPRQQFEIEHEDKGVFHVHTTMAEERTYNLDVSIQSPRGAELIRLMNVDFTHHHATDGVVSPEHSHTKFYLVLTIIGLLLLGVGVVIGKYLAKSGFRKQAMVSLLFLLLLPASQFKRVVAHEGEEHGPHKDVQSLTSVFEVPKESQFLVGILTEKIMKGAFQNSRRLYGTIIPSGDGQASVSCPQSGKVMNVNITAGDHVKQGQVLATIERINDSASEMNLAAEKNRAYAELESAKKELERLKSIEDIVSQKQMDEAKKNYEIAKQNSALFSEGNSRNFVLRAPMDGIVSAFTVSSGASVNAAENLFTIVNLKKVYAEAQAYEEDVDAVQTSGRFFVQCSEESHTSEQVKLLSIGQEFNQSNQSQRVLFEIENPNEDFKLGEFVNVWTYSKTGLDGIALPNSAITEVEGRTVVFVKNAAEKFEFRYVAVGKNNGSQTIILSGLKEEERVVVEGAYQMKLIYLNQ